MYKSPQGWILFTSSNEMKTVDSNLRSVLIFPHSQAFDFSQVSEKYELHQTGFELEIFGTEVQDLNLKPSMSL